MGMTIEDAKKLDHFLCSDCSSDDDAKRPLNAFPVSPSVETKVRNLYLCLSCFSYVCTGGDILSTSIKGHLFYEV